MQNSLGVNWTLETRKIKDLKSHHKNPRKLSKHDAHHLQRSIEKFGLADKPAINFDGTIIGGHQRIAILKRMGEKEVEVYVADRQLDQKDVDELNIRLNRNAGEWDFDILANEWEMDDLLDFGFTLEELSGKEVEDIEGSEEDDTDSKEKKTKCPKCGHEF